MNAVVFLMQIHKWNEKVADSLKEKERRFDNFRQVRNNFSLHTPVAGADHSMIDGARMTHPCLPRATRLYSTMGTASRCNIYVFNIFITKKKTPIKKMIKILATNSLERKK